MVFNKSKCIIRKTFCGNGNVPKDTATKKYSRKGTTNECLKKGFGIAQWELRNKNLPKNSLQQIMYIGPIYESNAKKIKINTIKGLIKKISELTISEKLVLLKKICNKSNNCIDQKALNSIILFLNDNGVKNLPSCKIVKE